MEASRVDSVIEELTACQPRGIDLDQRVADDDPNQPLTDAIRRLLVVVNYVYQGVSIEIDDIMVEPNSGLPLIDSTGAKEGILMP